MRSLYIYYYCPSFYIHYEIIGLSLMAVMALCEQFGILQVFIPTNTEIHAGKYKGGLEMSDLVRKRIAKTRTKVPYIGV